MVSLLLILLGDDNHLGSAHFMEDFFFFGLSHAGIEWSPRMDVAESDRNYIMTVEIPGVNINDIRVEVDDQK
jgi:HSP20 family molecular chaperone IbpA